METRKEELLSEGLIKDWKLDAVMVRQSEIKEMSGKNLWL